MERCMEKLDDTLRSLPLPGKWGRERGTDFYKNWGRGLGMVSLTNYLIYINE